ncbi:MAG TPA: 2-phospho-L-lactate transferase [Methylomirabilota bacterium]|nr:2-phospho-L-lactate transferase [Methylomirabilota bacterium]
MLAVFTGGTGGAKLIQGLSHEVDPAHLTIVCNTADDFVHHGLNISPDLDTIMYTLAGMSDSSKGWGIQGDTFTVLARLEEIGAETWFKIGDHDLATHIMRTQLLREGIPLSEITDKLRTRLAVKATILPMTDDLVETRVETPLGQISFQEYFVKHRWQPEVKKIFYAAVDYSKPAPGVIEAIRNASRIIICPSNPVTSIGPILAVPGIRDAIKKATASVIGVSPIIADSAISGPAHKMMAAQGWETSAAGVAKAYVDFLDTFVIDSSDEKLRGRIQGLGIKVAATSIRMDSNADKERLAREVLALAEK